MRRSETDRHLTAILVLALSSVFCGCLGSETNDSAAPERIIFIVIDMLRADRVGCYGSPTATPVLDSLADGGFMHPHVVSAYHQTTMSMAALFTGQTPSIEGPGPRRALPWNSRTWCGMRRFAVDGDESCVPQQLTTVAETMSARGYWTAGIVSNPLIFDPLGYSQGFQQWREVGTVTGARANLAQVRTRDAGKVLEAVASVLDERPSDRFFLYVHFMDVHDYGYYGLRYDKLVARTDAAIGKLLADIDGRGLLEGATIVVTSDHGERLGEKHALPGRPTHQGSPSFEPLLRVPLIVSPSPEVPVEPIFRGQNTRFLLERIAGQDTAPPELLHPQESFLSEIGFRTYRRYPFKAMWKRGHSKLWLFHLGTDPGEVRDVAAQRPALVKRIRHRMQVLTGKLRSKKKVAAGLSETDKARLRALGYLN